MARGMGAECLRGSAPRSRNAIDRNDGIPEPALVDTREHPPGFRRGFALVVLDADLSPGLAEAYRLDFAERLKHRAGGIGRIGEDQVETRPFSLEQLQGPGHRRGDDPRSIPKAKGFRVPLAEPNRAAVAVDEHRAAGAPGERF